MVTLLTRDQDTCERASSLRSSEKQVLGPLLFL